MTRLPDASRAGRAKRSRFCKASINNAELPIEEGLLEEAYLFQQTLRTEGAQRNMRRALEVGLQTREGESRMGQLALDFIEAAD